MLSIIALSSSILLVLVLAGAPIAIFTFCLKNESKPIELPIFLAASIVAGFGIYNILNIVRVQKGQKIMLSLDSYRGEIFEATVEKINPIMNERTKTFTIEALFKKAPHTLYPNLTIEANIVIQTRKNTLTIPRNVLSDSNTVTQSDGSIVKVKTGLKDFKKVEILSGIDISDELIIPIKWIQN